MIYAACCLFSVLQELEIPLIVKVEASSICSVLATSFNSPITLEMLTIPIRLKDHDDGEGSEDDVDSEESEDDTGYVPRIPLKHSGLKWRRFVDVLLRTSRSRSGISELNPIAQHILFDF